METVNTNVNMGESSRSSNINTSSSINSSAENGTNLNETNNTSTYQTGQYNESKIEEVDLSLVEETNTDEDKGLLSKVGDFFTDLGKSIYDTGASVVNSVTSWAEDRWNDLKGIGATLAETASNVASNVTSIIGSVRNWVSNAAATVASTGAVLLTSITSGVAKLGEHIVDGIAWGEGKIVNGASWALGSLIGLFNEDAGNAVKDYGQKFDQAAKEFIAEDWVGKANEWFYESTPEGQWINEHSAMKYDSEAAKKIMNVSEKAAEIAAATALTIFTGGAATFAIGALYGLGKQAESTYQENGTDTSLLQEAGIAGSGLLTGLSWMATGKLGKGFVEIGKTAANVGVKQVISKLSKDILCKDFWKKALKEGLTGMNGVGNYVSSAMMTSEELIPYLNGEKEWSPEAVGKLALIYLGNLGLNVAEDALRGYVGEFDSKAATEAINKATVATDAAGAEKMSEGAQATTEAVADNSSTVNKLEDTDEKPIVKDAEDTADIESSQKINQSPAKTSSRLKKTVDGYEDPITGKHYSTIQEFDDKSEKFEHILRGNHGKQVTSKVQGGHNYKYMIEHPEIYEIADADYFDPQTGKQIASKLSVDPDTGIIKGSWRFTGDGSKWKTDHHWFPESWDDSKIMKAVNNIVKNNDPQGVHLNIDDKAIYFGEYEGISMLVMTANGHVDTAYPATIETLEKYLKMNQWIDVR